MKSTRFLVGLITQRVVAFRLVAVLRAAQDDVVQFLSRLGVEEVETPIGAFNELYR